MPFGIASGPGGMWFTESEKARVGRITAAGDVTRFQTGFTANGRPTGIAVGSDGNLWITETRGTRSRA